MTLDDIKNIASDTLTETNINFVKEYVNYIMSNFPDTELWKKFIINKFLDSTVINI